MTVAIVTGVVLVALIGAFAWLMDRLMTENRVLREDFAHSRAAADAKWSKLLFEASQAVVSQASVAADQLHSEREQFLDAIFARTTADIGALRRTRLISEEDRGEAEVARAGGGSKAYREAMFARSPTEDDLRSDNGEAIIPVGMGH